MLMLKQQGYRLFLVYITTGDPEKNVAHSPRAHAKASQGTDGRHEDH